MDTDGIDESPKFSRGDHFVLRKNLTDRKKL